MRPQAADHLPQSAVRQNFQVGYRFCSSSVHKGTDSEHTESTIDFYGTCTNVGHVFTLNHERSQSLRSHGNDGNHGRGLVRLTKGYTIRLSQNSCRHRW